jgi:hypothetical protein
MNLVRSTHKTFAFPDSDGLPIGESGEDRTAQHEAQANHWMIMSAVICESPTIMACIQSVKQTPVPSVNPRARSSSAPDFIVIWSPKMITA